jgi:hypothetical protein
MVYIAGQALGILAGRSRSIIVSATLHAFANLKVVLPLAAAGIAGGGWWNERRIRHKNTEHMSDRIEQLEARLDPKRTSSKLTKQGKTRPQDRDT